MKILTKTRNNLRLAVLGHHLKQTGTKHGRLLMRQPRVKKESELGQGASPESEPGSPRIVQPSGSSSTTTSPSSSTPTMIQQATPTLKLPTLSRDLSWDEADSGVISSGKTITLTTSNAAPTNLLAVPQPSYLVKQHSHPLLPSQQPPTTSNYWSIQRQHSNPEYPGGSSSPKSQSDPPIPLIKIDEGSTSRQMEQTTKTVRMDSAGSPSGGIRLVPAELLRSSSAPQSSTSTSESRTLSSRESTSDHRLGHCPVQRPGPALGCNHCWNTIDTHGRILRRKTKYHCPECQINLCIVPCFQEFHERPREISNPRPLPKTSSI